MLWTLKMALDFARPHRMLTLLTYNDLPFEYMLEKLAGFDGFSHGFVAFCCYKCGLETCENCSVRYTRSSFLLILTILGLLVICPFPKLSLVACLQIAMFSGRLHRPYSSFTGAGRPLCANSNFQPTNFINDFYLNLAVPQHFVYTNSPSINSLLYLLEFGPISLIFQHSSVLTLQVTMGYNVQAGMIQTTYGSHSRLISLDWDILDRQRCHSDGLLLYERSSTASVP